MKTAQQILEIEATTGWANEDKMQESYYQFARNNYRELYGLLFSVPNGGSRNKIEAMKFVATGLTAGVPDLLLISPLTGKLTGIELKLPGGTVSAVQEQIHEVWRSAGITVHIVRDFTHFITIIQEQI